MLDLITTATRERELSFSLAKAGQVRREIEQPLGNQMNDFASSLNLPANAHHTRRHQDPSLFLEQ